MNSKTLVKSEPKKPEIKREVLPPMSKADKEIYRTSISFKINQKDDLR